MRRYFPALLAVFLLLSCEDTNIPVMTDAARDAVTAITLGDEDVNHLARRAAQMSDSEHRVAPPGSPYDNRLRKILADHYETDGQSFNFKVYLEDDVNAFAMADGTIRVYSGLMDLMSDQELLFVIGHEMGHVLDNHSRKKMVLAYASSALRKGLASQNNEVGQVARSVLGSFAQQLANAQFSQVEEKAADQHGLAFLKAGGYDTVHAVSALKKLSAVGGQHSFLSSHPDPAIRAKKLLEGEENRIDKKEPLVARLKEYWKKLTDASLYFIRSLLDWVLAFI